MTDHANDQSDPLTFTVRFRVDSPLHEGDEWPSIARIKGTIICERDRGGFSERCVAGQIVGYRIYSERIFKGGLSVWDHVEGLGEAMKNYYRALYEDGYSFVKEVSEAFPDTENFESLVLHSLYITPHHRGRGLGAMAARRFIDQFGPLTGMVVCRPFPVQFDPGYRRPRSWDFTGLRTRRAPAICALRQLARGLGFQRLGRSEYFGLCPSRCPEPRPIFGMDIDVPIPREMVGGKSPSHLES